MHSDWRLLLAAKTNDKAHRILRNVTGELGRSLDNIRLQRDWDSRHTVSFTLTHRENSWNDAVVEVIRLGQLLAAEWRITGTVAYDLTAHSRKATMPGVESIQWQLSRSS